MTFDIVGISETKEQVRKGFLTNVNLKGYAFYSQPSDSSAGGVGLYIKTNLNYSIRKDLHILEDEFECIWVEKITQKVQTYYAVAHSDIQTLILKSSLSIWI